MRKRHLRKAGKWAAAGLGGLLLLALAGFAALQTPWAKRLLASQASAALSRGLGWKADMSTPEGVLPFTLRIPSLRLSDGQGEWLALSDVSLSVRPWPLGEGAASVALSLGEATVSRVPVLPPDQGPPPAPSRPLAFLDGLAPIPVEGRADVTVRSLRLGAPLAGRELSGSLRLDARARGGAAQARLECSLDGEAGTRAGLEARFDPGARAARLDLKAEEAAGGILASLAGLPPDLPIAATLLGEGPLSGFKAAFTATSGGTEMLSGTLEAGLGRTSADDARVALALEADPFFLPVPPQVREALGGKPRLSLTGVLSSVGLPDSQWKVLVEDLTVTGKAASATLSGDSGPMGLSPRLTFGLNVSEPGALGMKSGPVAASGTLDADVDPAGPFRADVSLSSPDLASALSPLGVELGGKAEIKARMKGDVKSLDFTALLDASLREIVPGGQGFGPKIAAALGSRAALRIEAGLERGRRVAVDTLRFESRGLSLTASGRYDLDVRAAELMAEANAPDLALFAGLAGTALGGRASLKAQAQGEIASPLISFSVEAGKLAVDTTRLDLAALTVKARPEKGGVAGDLSAEAVRGKGKLAVSTAFSLAGRKLGVTGLRAAGPGLDLSGDVTASLDNKTASGSLTASAGLAELGGFLGRSMAGKARLEAKFSAGGQSQDVTARFEATGVAAGGVRVSRAALDASVRDALRAPKGEAAISLSGVAAGEAALESLTFKARGSGRDAVFDLAAKGAFQGPFRASAGGAFAPAPGGGKLTLASFKADVRGVDISLTRPASAVFEPGGLGLAGLTLAVGGGTVTASGTMKPSRVDFSAEVAALPLPVLGKFGLPPLTGTASAGLVVTGSPSRPRVSATLGLDGVKAPALEGREVPAMALKAMARLDGGRLEADCSVSAGPEAAFDARAALPARLSLSPFDFAVPRDAALEGALSGSVDLARAAALSGDESLSLKGILKADFTASGKLSAPALSGGASLDGGEAAYVSTGTRLRDIFLEVTASGGEVAIKRFSARDMGQGSLSATGKADLASAHGVLFWVQMVADKLTPVRMDLVTAAVSAKVDASGDARGAKVAGGVHVGPVEVNLPDRIPPDATPIQVTRVNAPGGPALQAPAPSAPYPVELDVAVDFPGRIFVRGLGLDSVWAGYLHTKGLASQPVIDGAVRIVKGQLDFFGKNFSLARGEVTFHGSDPPAPMLDIEAQAQTGDLTASILVTGPATRPKIDFTSDPAVPRDEILARVLFGQSVSSLTPPQALQLAQAVATISGAGGSLDFLGKTRKLAGLDYLGVKSTGKELGQSSVAAGKYIADGVYVEASQGLGASSGAVSVEVDVTRNITVESKVGLDSKTGVGINWKFDY
ncbi:MAG: translocation/assembly module TamB domain-containing protein [Thermodesulfobacteriota bacterium]